MLSRWRLEWAWVFDAVLLLLFGLIAGLGITGSWKGLFVDERFKASLARFQMVFSTVIVFTAFLAAARYNPSHGGAGRPRHRDSEPAMDRDGN